MSNKPNPKLNDTGAHWEVVEDSPSNEELQQFAQSSLQRALHRLTHPFRRAPDEEDPTVKARNAANEILDEADAMLNDLFDKYRSRLNTPDAEEPRKPASRSAFRPAAWITRIDEDINVPVDNAQEQHDVPDTGVADTAASKEEVTDVTPPNAQQQAEDDEFSASDEPDDQLKSTNISKEHDHD